MELLEVRETWMENWSINQYGEESYDVIKESGTLYEDMTPYEALTCRAYEIMDEAQYYGFDAERIIDGETGIFIEICGLDNWISLEVC